MSGTRSTITFTNLDTGDNIIIRTNGGVKPTVEKGKKRLASTKDFSSPNPKKSRCTVIDLTEEKSPRVFTNVLPVASKEIVDLDRIEEPKLSSKPKRIPKRMLTKVTAKIDLSDPSADPTKVRKKKSSLERTRKYPKRKTAEEKRREKEDLEFAKNLQRQFDSEPPVLDDRYHRGFNDDDDLPSYETLSELKPHVPARSIEAGPAANGLIAASWTNAMDNKSCTICMEDFENSESVKVTDCFHVYHGRCIEEWFKVSKRCPVCKHECGNSLQ
jgi:hypothetical protein